MGFFSKDKVTLNQLAESLADLAFDSISDDSLKIYKPILRDMGESEEIYSNQKREMLIFMMLATTRAIHNVMGSESKDLLDKFHQKVYDKVSDDRRGQKAFEDLVNKRYQAYYKILASQEDNMLFRLGKEFSVNFLGKEGVNHALVLIVSSADIFSSHTVAMVGFLKETMEKFQLIK